MGEVRTVDRGADAVVAAAAKLARSRAAVEIGVLGSAAGDAATNGGGVSVGEIAEFHEFGLGVPRRSFIGDWAAENEAEIQTKLRDIMQPVLLGRRTEEEAFGLFGLWAQGQIQARIAAGIEPPLADATVDKKGSSVPLIDTGQLRSSITYRVTT